MDMLSKPMELSELLMEMADKYIPGKMVVQVNKWRQKFVVT
jgi:hypothetical protein